MRLDVCFSLILGWFSYSLGVPNRRCCLVAPTLKCNFVRFEDVAWTKSWTAAKDDWKLYQRGKCDKISQESHSRKIWHLGRIIIEISALLKKELSKVSSNFAENNIIVGDYLDEVTFREDLYPRFSPNPVLIQQYSDCIETLPPIENLI